MAREGVVSGKMLGAGVDSVDEHVGLLHLRVGLESRLEVLGLAGVGVEQHGYLEQFVHGHSVHVELSVVEAVLLGQLGPVLGPDGFGEFKQLRVSGNRVGPEYALHVDGAAVHSEFLDGE